MTKKLWLTLCYLDCWVVDKWTGRGWEYYSAVLGDKKRRGVIGKRWHQWRIYRLLNYLEKFHCEKALRAKPPSQDWRDIW